METINNSETTTENITKKIIGLRQSKEILLRNLEKLKREALSKTKFIFICVCKRMHVISAAKRGSNKKYGVIPGEFIVMSKFQYPQQASDLELYLYVGIGKHCNSDPMENEKYLYFLERGKKIIFSLSLEEFNKRKKYKI